MITAAARRLGLRRSASAVWAVALLVYVLAVFHRSSLAVAGLAATDRFDITAAQLSAFTVLQLVVYAGMQIPVGLALDRWGPRAVIFAGVLTLSVAQTVFALADSYPLAVAARVAVGAGDAMVFVCVLRLVNTWFEPRQIPLMTQLTGISGQAGTIVAAAPMTWALHALGWTTSYLITAGVGLVLAAALLAVVHDRPGARNVRGPDLELRGIGRRIRTAWSDPGTRLGFWTHFSTQFSGTVLALLWGFPYFVRGEHASAAFASLLLTVLILATMAAGPVVAWRTSTRPERRTRLVLGIVGSIATVWLVVLAWPGDAPRWLLLLLVVVVAVGGPGSLVGFDFVRTYGVPQRLGLATAVVNMGGFIASLSTVLVIGIVLDLMTPGGSQAYPADAFRWAMAVQVVPWVIGGVQIWRHQRLLDRREPAPADGEPAPAGAEPAPAAAGV